MINLLNLELNLNDKTSTSSSSPSFDAHTLSVSEARLKSLLSF